MTDIRADDVLCTVRDSKGYNDIGGRDVETAAVFNGLPVREARAHRGQPQISGLWWTATTGSLVPFESMLERDRLILADHDTSVDYVLAQPLRLTTQWEGRTRRHVPDFLCRRPGRPPLLVDVKPAHRVDKPGVGELLQMTAAIADALHWEYEIWTGCDAVVMVNMRFLAGYRRPWLFSKPELEQALQLVQGADEAGGGAAGTSIRAVLAGAAPSVPVAVLKPMLFHLMWTQQLLCSLLEPLNPDTWLEIA